jgi:autotransporter-associated beta strand protein
VLAWNNAMGTGEWDVQGNANWTNRTTHVSPDVFYAFDAVVFDDTVTNSPTPTTTINVGSGQVVTPGAMTNNSSLDYTIAGDGQISGAGGLTKQGSGTLTLNVAGDFTGPARISGGKLKTAKPALGSVASITVTNDGTLDFAGSTISGNKPVTVSGAGVSGGGALFNSGGDIYGNVLNVTLAGDTTFGGSTRWDLASGSKVGGPYKLTIRRSDSGGYGEWDGVTVSNNVGDVELSVGKLGLKNMSSSFGNPASALIVKDGCEVDFYTGGCNRTMRISSNAQMKVIWNSTATFAGSLVLDEAANLGSFWGGVATFNSPVTLNGVAHIYIGDADCIFNNVLSGPGGFLIDYWNHKMILEAANTYTGPTLIANGMVVALGASGSISQSSLIFFGGGSATSVHLDASGRSDQTLTLASGQTLAGMGAVAGNLAVSSGAVLSPAGTNTTLGVNLGANQTGTISAAGNITLNGTTVIKLNGSGANDVVQAAGSIAYGGTLSLVNISASPLVAGNSFTIFNATSRSGSFTITPATPGAGLVWDTTQLNAGIISVAPAPGSQPVISSITISGGNVILSGTNGPASGNYYVLTSTNVASPLGQWKIEATNTFNGGNFSYTNSVGTDRQRFYLIQVP